MILSYIFFFSIHKTPEDKPKMASKEKVKEAIEIIITVPTLYLSQCLEELQKSSSHQKKRKYERIIVMSDTESESEHPQRSRSHPIEGSKRVLCRDPADFKSPVASKYSVNGKASDKELSVNAEDAGTPVNGEHTNSDQLSDGSEISGTKPRVTGETPQSKAAIDSASGRPLCSGKLSENDKHAVIVEAPVAGNTSFPNNHSVESNLSISMVSDSTAQPPSSPKDCQSNDQPDLQSCSKKTSSQSTARTPENPGTQNQREEQSNKNTFAQILERNKAQIDQLLTLCPCTFALRSTNNEDFRLRDIRAEEMGTNAFKASLAYLSFALEFHDYELSQCKNSISQSLPRLELLYNHQHSRSKTHRFRRWTQEKGIENSVQSRRALTIGLKMCLLRRLVADGYNLKQEESSIVVAMIRTFYRGYFPNISWNELFKRAASLNECDAALRLVKDSGAWFHDCYWLYNLQDEVPHSFRHKCDLQLQDPLSDLSFGPDVNVSSGNLSTQGKLLNSPISAILTINVVAIELQHGGNNIISDQGKDNLAAAQRAEATGEFYMDDLLSQMFEADSLLEPFPRMAEVDTAPGVEGIAISDIERV